ncbi:unnamed protein product [Closterium sp. Yama58-4]|nr:unnamed protein product [Closterium sp. Yama58-4]
MLRQALTLALCCCDTWQDVDGRAVLLASRDIKKGEQVFISYVEESLPLEERKEALADYGFVCRCDLCVAQGEQA